MGKYFNAGTRFRSILSGALVFIAVWTALYLIQYEHPALLALLAAAVAVLLFSFIYPLRLWLFDRRYAGIEDTLPKPVILKARIAIRTKTKPREGYLYLTEDTLYLYSRSRKPFACETFAKGCIHDLKEEGGMCITFRNADSAMYSIASPDCEEILNALRSGGWNV